ncbi:Xaa-Pro dipeptidyl-peptidase [Weissella viridescens]|uniref:Xaa-Pro dipeptidyl-peptidase n=1 Tax=Weissella viridescens TaxID=1629 RepID=UPI001D0639AB|nr:Xaa-Pro dipeptidyl-peptidase [Weissella viridescens]MCB6839441.1 Xaa-Pro dipeptidyl-peptidase [Weissella viridescens]MCB6846172.1 Xaa-Pro dipeptidyl-peptidase [Weissella viridescens]
MKNNQFGRMQLPLATELWELKNIHFLEADVLDTPKAQLIAFLQRAWAPLVTSPAAFDQKLSQLLATPDTTMADFLASAAPLTADIFARLALQLLQFEPETDYDIADPLSAYSTLQLPTFDVETFQTANDVAHAWYQLLSTHTKNGETYLDYLTQTGYFVPFYGQITGPVFFNGKAQAVFNPHETIHEIVYVEAPLDTDHDGKRDLLKVEVSRPKLTNSGYKAPVLYTASPYNQGTNDTFGEKITHSVDVPLTEKAPNQLTAADVQFQSLSPELPPERIPIGETVLATEHFAKEQSYTLNNYFLSRGFAVVYAAGIGTRDSDGLRDTGGPAETLSTVAIIEWLDGQRQAFTNKTDRIAIPAWWTNQHIAMTGRSYLGTLATAAATTGVDGLKTVISEAAISSWYDYYRDNGLVAAPDTFQGEDMDVLAGDVFSRMQDAGDYLGVKKDFEQVLSQLQKDQDRHSGSYTAYWDGRNYLNQVANIKADMILVHGLNDWNVKPRNVYNLWQSLRELPIHKKIILHQGQHIYINNFRSLDFTDMMNLWLSYKLFDLNNGADTLLPDVLIQDNVTAETWHPVSDWPAATDQHQTLYLDQDHLTETKHQTPQVQTFNDQLSQETFKRYCGDLSAWHTDLFKSDTDENALHDNRLIFKTAPLTETWTIDGTPEITVDVAVDASVGMLSFQLVDYGDAKRLGAKPTLLAKNVLSGAYDWRTDDLYEFMPETQVTPWKMITKGHVNLQNRTHAYQDELVVPNTFNQVHVTLQPTFYRLPAGHQLGLVIYATDFETTIRGNQNLTYQINLTASQLNLRLADNHE